MMQYTKKEVLAALIASAILCLFFVSALVYADDIGCVVANGGLKMREDISTDSEVVIVIPNGQRFRIIGYNDVWYEGIYCGKHGFLYHEYVSVISNNVPAQEMQASGSATGDNIVAEAKKYLGYPYVAGGNSPETGFDCSGFTSYIYSRFGYSIPRSSAGQAEVGVGVEKENLLPGDLLIFQNFEKTGIGHVAIYIGGGEMIHAPNSNSVVKIVPISMDYYAERYVTARRVIN